MPFNQFNKIKIRKKKTFSTSKTILPPTQSQVKRERREIIMKKKTACAYCISFRWFANFFIVILLPPLFNFFFSFSLALSKFLFFLLVRLKPSHIVINISLNCQLLQSIIYARSHHDLIRTTSIHL